MYTNKILIIGDGDIGNAVYSRLCHDKNMSVTVCHHDDYTEFITKEMPNVVINCCGLFDFTSIYEDLTLGLEKWDKIFAANVKTAWEISSNFYHTCKNSQYRKILLHIGSESAKMPHANSIAYCCSKAALQMMTKCLAKAIGNNDFRVFQINCGMTSDTSIAAKIMKRFPEAKQVSMNFVADYIIAKLFAAKNGTIYNI